MKIVFTSCMDARRVPDQPIWAQMASEKPDVLALLGDQIYMDWAERPNWRQRLGTDGPWSAAHQAVLDEFAKDMHARYAAQWAVAGFRELLLQVKQRNPQGLLVMWDDHDFAWNNSQGGGFPAGAHSVRPEVKFVVRQLFLQFRDRVCNHPDTVAYPTMSPLGGPPPLEGVQQFGTFADGPHQWPFALLDNRWHRTAYPSQTAGATLLGTTQWAQLEPMLAASDGLLIVLAGTPVQHRYRLSQLGEGWIAKDGTSAYPEYPHLMASKRPVLFLAGDIHHNEWGGRLYWTDGTGRRSSEVIQLCASAAAVGNMGPVRTVPSYGVVELKGSPQAGSVIPRLMSGKQGVYQENPPLQPDIAFDATRWLSGFLDGVAAADDPWQQPDDELLHVLTAREFAKPKSIPVTVKPAPDLACSITAQDMDALDALYSQKIQTTRGVATPTAIVVSGDAFQIQIPGVGSLKDAPNTEHMVKLLKSAFDTAQDKGRSVVFFIHGFGKSPAEAVMQAYQLRMSYPGVEPVLFSWQAGESGGFLKTYNDGKDALRNALNPGTQLSLDGALAAFGQLAKAYPAVNSVVLARSLGTVALANVVNKSAHLNFKGYLSHVKRIVLSSAAVSRDRADVEFKWLTLMGLQVVVTVNKNDQTLRLANWLDGLGRTPLGTHDPAPFGQDDLYLDFTNSANVGKLHDYLFPRLSEAQFKVNHALLTQAAFNPADFSAELEASGPGVYNVK